MARRGFVVPCSLTSLVRSFSVDALRRRRPLSRWWNWKTHRSQKPGPSGVEGSTPSLDTLGRGALWEASRPVWGPSPSQTLHSTALHARWLRCRVLGIARYPLDPPPCPRACITVSVQRVCLGPGPKPASHDLVGSIPTSPISEGEAASELPPAANRVARQGAGQFRRLPLLLSGAVAEGFSARLKTWRRWVDSTRHRSHLDRVVELEDTPARGAGALRALRVRLPPRSLNLRMWRNW